GRWGPDLTVVKVVTRKLYSIKQQARELNRQLVAQKLAHRASHRESAATATNTTNRLSSVLRGTLALFRAMSHHLRKDPPYSIRPEGVFVCSVHLSHMLDTLAYLLSLAHAIESPNAAAAADASSPTIDTLMDMIQDTKTLCKQFHTSDPTTTTTT
ncbi:hypothetical protein Ahia01_001402200, partial [Argonauta hians]